MLFIGSPPSHPTPTNHDTKLLKNQSTLELTQACCLLFFTLVCIHTIFFPQNPNQLLQRRKYVSFAWISLPYSHCHDNSCPLFPYPPSVGLWLYGLYFYSPFNWLQPVILIRGLSFSLACELKALLHPSSGPVFMLDPHFKFPELTVFHKPWWQPKSKVLVAIKVSCACSPNGRVLLVHRDNVFPSLCRVCFKRWGVLINRKGLFRSKVLSKNEQDAAQLPQYRKWSQINPL